MMDLITQAHMAMQPNVAKTAAEILNNGRPTKFVGNVHNHYVVTVDHDGSHGNAMAFLVDTLESNGFGHVNHTSDDNEFIHKETEKRITVNTEKSNASKITFYVKRL